MLKNNLGSTSQSGLELWSGLRTRLRYSQDRGRSHDYGQDYSHGYDQDYGHGYDQDYGHGLQSRLEL